MSQQLGGQQILILKEGSTRTRGRDAQGMNITAAKAVASAVRTTLGPKGMDKMLVDTIGDVSDHKRRCHDLKGNGHRAPGRKDDGRGCKRPRMTSR